MIDVSCGACGQVVSVSDDVGVVTPCPNCRTPIDLHTMGTRATPPPGARPKIGVGQKLGGFVLERELGRGGMGIVYQARQLSLGRMVAVKVLPEDLTTSVELRARFDREAGALALLNHPNIVSIYDRGFEGGTYYFAMEYVEGKSLRQMLAARRLTPPEIVYVMDAVLQALSHAHEKGIVHRDLKPENIMMDQQGRPKVMDFGIAHLFDTPEAAALTGTRAFLGTLQYMAPEQMGSAATVDGRADLFATGVILYEMLTGTVPRGVFRNPSQTGIGVTAAFDPIVVRALQPDPADRYENAEAMREEITALPISTPSRSTPPGSAGRAGGGTVRPTLPVGRTIAVPPMRARTQTHVTETSSRGGGGGLGLFLLAGVLVFGAVLVAAGGGIALYLSSRPGPTPVIKKNPLAPRHDATGDRHVVNIKGTQGEIKSFKLYEGPKDTQGFTPTYTTRFPRWSTRYVWWEIDLSYPTPRQRIEFELKWTMRYPDGTIRSDLSNTYYLDPSDGHTYYSAGLDGPWSPGTHQIQVFLDNNLIAQGNFEIYRDDLRGGRIYRQTDVPRINISGVNAEIYELLFYEGAEGFPAIEDRVFETGFSAAKARYINWHTEIHYPPIQKPVDYKLRWVLKGVGGKTLNDDLESFTLDPKFTTLYLSGGWGNKEPGKGWDPGLYTVDLYYGNTRIASASYEVQ